MPSAGHLKGDPPILCNGHHDASYRIVIGRAGGRPRAQVYLFGIRDPIPTFPLPLRDGDEEPRVDIGHLLHEIYDRARHDLAVDYSQPPSPPSLSDEDAAWLDEHLRSERAPIEDTEPAYQWPQCCSVIPLVALPGHGGGCEV